MIEDYFFNFFIDPFLHYAFMKKALATTIIISLGCAPLGLLMLYRRMSLMGDALSHAMLPGVALGFFFFKGNPLAMMIGGLLASILVSWISDGVSHKSDHFKDSNFAVFYLVSLAIGIMIISIRGTNQDLSHVLFGNILAIPDQLLLIVASVSTATLIFCTLFIRPLIIQTVDPNYLKRPLFWSWIFLFFVVAHLVTSFQTMGTLLSIGVLLIPSAAATFWSIRLLKIFLLSLVIGIASCYMGLILSYHYDSPPGPSIICIAGFFFLFSFLFGQERGLIKRYRKNHV